MRPDTIADDVAKTLLLERIKMKRSNHVLLIKKLPFSTSEADLVQNFNVGAAEASRLTPSPPTKWFPIPPGAALQPPLV